MRDGVEALLPEMAYVRAATYRGTLRKEIKKRWRVIFQVLHANNRRIADLAGQLLQ
jgi:hypothetical protein